MSRLFLIDVSPLRDYPAFRYLFAARATTFFVLGILNFAVNLQIYNLTKSALSVAMLSICVAAPMTVSMLFGGVLADRYDKRKLMMWSRTAHLGAVALLLINAMMDQPLLWPIYGSAAIAGTAAGISMPAFMAAMPAIVGRGNLAAAAALGSLTSQASGIIGPALAGLLMMQWGTVGCYGVVAIGSVLTPLFLTRLPALPPPKADAPQAKQKVFTALRNAFSYAMASQIIAGLLLIDVAATLFATPFAALPQFGAQVLNGDERTIGLMFAAPAAGAFLAAFVSGWISRLERSGQALILAVCGWGFSVFALGFAPNIPLALVFLVAMGFADTVSEVLRGSLLQQHTPDHLLGRLSSLWLIQATLTPALGNVAIGALAETQSLRISFALGGTACLLAALAIALWLPGFRRMAAVSEAKS